MEKAIVINKSFVQDNGVYTPVSSMEGTRISNVPPAIYSIIVDKYGIFHAKKNSDNVKLPEVVYDTGYDGVINKVVNHYMTTDKATGAIFHGPAGVGKSISSQLLQNRFIEELKRPVYLVSEAFHGQEFMDFVNDLGDGLFVFDEFEKHYGEEEQEKLLSLFDGADSRQKRLAIIIANYYRKICPFYKNRNGRIRYVVEWESLPVKFMNDYLSAELVDKSFKDSIILWAEGIPTVTFDNLEAVTKECNKYPQEEFEDIIRYLNIPNKNIMSYFKVLHVIDLQPAVEEKVRDNTYPKFIKAADMFDLALTSSTYGTENSITLEKFYLEEATYKFDGTITISNNYYRATLREISREEYEKRPVVEENLYSMAKVRYDD